MVGTLAFEDLRLDLRNLITQRTPGCEEDKVHRRDMCIAPADRLPLGATLTHIPEKWVSKPSDHSSFQRPSYSLQPLSLSSGSPGIIQQGSLLCLLCPRPAKLSEFPTHRIGEHNIVCFKPLTFAKYLLCCSNNYNRSPVPGRKVLP